MTSEIKFDFQDFKPRTGVRQKVNSMLRELMKFAPRGSSSRALIRGLKEGFMISVVVTGPAGILSSEKYHSKKAMTGKDRHWQAEAVAGVLGDLKAQIERWEKNRRVTAAVVAAPRKAVNN